MRITHCLNIPEKTCVPVPFCSAEAQGRCVVSVSPEQEALHLRRAEEFGVPAMKLGALTEGSIQVNDAAWGSVSFYQRFITAAGLI